VAAAKNTKIVAAKRTDDDGMNILGLSDITGNHSHSSVCLVQDGRLIFAISQERISRRKNDSRFPAEAIQTALQETRLSLSDIDAVACAYPPPRYYASLLQRNVLDLPRALWGVASSRPDRLFKYLAPNLRKALLDPHQPSPLLHSPVQFIGHHLSHVTAAYCASGFDDCLGISYGGFAPHANGYNVAGAVYRCRGDRIEFLEDIPFYATGCYFSGITVALGFRYMQQEGKTMGLAGLGDPSLCYDQLRTIATVFQDGQWQPYKNWIDYVFAPRAEVLMASHSGRILHNLVQKYEARHVAAAAQKVWQDSLLALTNHVMKKYGCDKLALAGGTFLNINAVQAIVEQSEAKAVFVFPHTGDGSTPIGAAWQVWLQHSSSLPHEPLTQADWGCAFAEEAVRADLASFADRLVGETVDQPARVAAERIAQGGILGWFQGREEYGPRSLGQRCILADPRPKDMRRRLNEAKKREPWIPAGVSCLAEQGGRYFQHWQAQPFMSRSFAFLDRERADQAAAGHDNATCRVQAVASGSGIFRTLLECFYDLTGTAMVLNTSLNRHSEPIVHRPAEAMALVVEGVIDELMIGRLLIRKR
jgi:carbamoyltransferase